MKTLSIGTLAAILIGVAATLLIVIGAPSARRLAVAPEEAAPARPSLSAGGFTLASVADALPADDTGFPVGPGAEVATANCTACHSASMALTQPPLTPEQWAATVKKMREIYHAPVAEADVPAIVAYLARLPGQPNAAGPPEKG